jgi:hypothetical protein
VKKVNAKEIEVTPMFLGLLLTITEEGRGDWNEST